MLAIQAEQALRAARAGVGERCHQPRDDDQHRERGAQRQLRYEAQDRRRHADIDDEAIQYFRWHFPEAVSGAGPRSRRATKRTRGRGPKPCAAQPRRDRPTACCARAQSTALPLNRAWSRGTRFSCTARGPLIEPEIMRPWFLPSGSGSASTGMYWYTYAAVFSAEAS